MILIFILGVVLGLTIALIVIFYAQQLKYIRFKNLADAENNYKEIIRDLNSLIFVKLLQDGYIRNEHLFQDNIFWPAVDKQLKIVEEFILTDPNCPILADMNLKYKKIKSMRQ